jgi:ribosomal protein S18 acetylase RimI-like enzyme
MDIRKAKTEDIEAVLSITKACAIDLISKGIYQWSEHYPNKKDFKNDIENCWLYVVENDNEIIGCISISTHMDQEYQSVKWLSKSNKNIYIHRLAVDPKNQSKGYALQLMDFAENYGKQNNYESIRLDTFSKNLRNQRFYERRGYVRLENVYFLNQSQDPFYCYELIL